MITWMYFFNKVQAWILKYMVHAYYLKDVKLLLFQKSNNYVDPEIFTMVGSDNLVSQAQGFVSITQLSDEYVNVDSKPVFTAAAVCPS